MSKVLLKKEKISKNILLKNEQFEPKKLKIDLLGFLEQRFQKFDLRGQEKKIESEKISKKEENEFLPSWIIEIPKEIKATVQKIGNGTFLIFQTDRGILHHRLPYRFPLVVKKTTEGQLWKVTACLDETTLAHKVDSTKSSLEENIRIIYQILVGLSRGYKKKIKMVGVGYKAFLEKSNLEKEKPNSKEHLKITLGYSHTNFLELDPNISVKFSRKNNRIHFLGSSLPQLGETAALLHAMKKPDVYKGKGVRYLGVKLRKKEGKKQK